jgi:OMF family outer membrane factor
MKDQEQGGRHRGLDCVLPSARTAAARRGAAAIAGAILAVTFVAPGRAEIVKLDADTAMVRIVQVSHAAAAASERESATRETVSAADAATLPSLSAGASLARLSSVPEFRLPFAVPGQQPLVLVPDITTAYATNMRLQQTLYSGGAISGLRQATRDDTEASARLREQTVADLRVTARLAYWEAVRAAASVDAAHAQERRAARLLDDTQSLFAVGMAVNADVLAAKERVASARVGVIAAETAAANALAQLHSLLQIDPSDTVELADSLTGPLPNLPGTAEELQHEALATRSELAVSSAQLAALHAREELAKAPSRPAVGAVAEYDVSRPNQRYFPETDRWQDSWSVGVAASWTLYDGGKSRADTAASRFAQRAAVQDREELTRRIQLEVENDRRNLESALATVDSADAAHDAATEREVAARERHAAGLAAMAEILDAEAQLAAADQQQIDARSASWMAAATLARAIGR